MRYSQSSSFTRRFDYVRPAKLYACFVLIVVPLRAAAAADQAGAQIYRQKCASCHGTAGEGTDEHYAAPLAGERSAASLARLIARTMPDDDPGTCVGEEAEKVAKYVYDSFYSKAAQSRNNLQLPRIELSRLTVRQYRNVVADLIGTFRSPGKWDDQRGISGDYAASRRGRGGGGRGLKKTDPEIKFEFGTSSPIPEQDKLKEISKQWVRLPVLYVPLQWFRPFSQDFRINWQGSVLAPETGEYEFVVKTENAIRLWVNDTVRPLIDAGVKSGNDREYRGSITLLGGRAYPLRLEFSRSKNEATSSVVLEWKSPGRASEVIPRQYLSPNRFSETFVSTTPFPPDDRSMGYERGTSISKAWDQATTDAALDITGYVIAHLKELAGVGDDAADRAAKLQDFCRRFAERAFRRPLSEEQKAFFIDRLFKGTRDPVACVKRSLLLVLKSPRFLYREIGRDQPDGYDVASRISFALWDSLPDQPLLDAAAARQLADRDQVARHAERMVTDLRAHSKLREFLLQWSKADQVPDLAKDAKLFPYFNEAILSDLRTSLVLFLEEVIGSKPADFRQLLSADYLFLNGRLAEFYQAPLPPDAPFQKVSLRDHQRAGVLTHPYLMTVLAYTATSSPIHRGVYIARGILGRVLRPPPEAVVPLAPALHPSLTTRERVVLQTKPESCQSCHGMINPLGLTLEHFDAVGRYRNEENGRTVDATGRYETRAGDAVKFDGVRDLAAFLVQSEETHSAFVRQLFQFFVKQSIRAFGSQELPELRRYFEEQDFNIRKLVVEIVATSSLTQGNARR
jgi:Protein of unknown function (DUF1592)/Protein of unknown function (DUF1588)/PA14 domain/Protein of unknown function (DUF1595)/Cytochrome C oxidase, cbb3-type, subunit III/Protein of unknown function (DUF1585)